MKISRHTEFELHDLRDTTIKAGLLLLALALVIIGLYGIVWLFHTGRYLIASSIIALPLVLGIVVPTLMLKFCDRED